MGLPTPPLSKPKNEKENAPPPSRPSMQEDMIERLKANKVTVKTKESEEWSD